MKRESGSFPTLDALVEQLEALSADLPEVPDLEEIAGYVEARAPLAATIAQIDVAELFPHEKRSLGGRMRRVLERDQALVTALFARRDDVARQLRDASRGRTAVRGYSDRERSPMILRKTA